MKLIDHTFSSVAENLAYEEALLLEAEEQSLSHSPAQNSEILRFWDAESNFTVLGRGSKVQQEIEQQVAQAQGVPIYRRISGGATIVAGPGCMFYALLLSIERRPYLQHLDRVHDFVRELLTSALQPLVPEIQWQGTCDLVVDRKKVSGNSLRVARKWILYHGTLLLGMDLGLISQVLKHPPREPEYREGRLHQDFLTNLQVKREDVVTNLARICRAEQADWQRTTRIEKVQELVANKYSQASWNLSR